jgi:prepilin-type N-terminal cleavage/methylation domain-containing protein
MRNQGFTFFELSIVLFIVALLMGGVLAAQEVMYTANVRRAVADQQAIRTAIGAFQQQYNCLPGDCANQSTLFTLTAADNQNAQNGNGNGRYETGYGPPTQEGSYRLWEVLGKSGLFPGAYIGKSLTTTGLDRIAPDPGSNTPIFSWFAAAGSDYIHYSSAISKGIAVVINYSVPCGAYSVAGCEPNQPFMPFMQTNTNKIGYLGLDPSGNAVPWFGLKCEFIYAVDKKMDDGFPLKGQVRTYGNSYLDPSHSCGNRNLVTDAQTNDPTATYHFAVDRVGAMYVELGL